MNDVDPIEMPESSCLDANCTLESWLSEETIPLCEQRLLI
jgi:hypothetical protein